MPNYTLQYVYDLDDFLTTGSNITPPDEQGARAQGNPPFNITLAGGASPQQITVTDTDDNAFDEINSSGQTLAFPVTLSGVTYPAGSSILVNYIITTDSGFEMMSFTIGAGNTGNNTTTAVVTTQPITPGVQYIYTSESNVGGGSVPYSEFACFTKGTMILTDQGEKPIEDLAVGDLVETMDNGLQPIRWIGNRQVLAKGAMAPIVFAKDAYGNDRELTVSPQHRMLFTGYKAELLFGEAEILVAAKNLVNNDRIYRKKGGFVHYFHLLFDRHEIIYSNGVATESFFIGDNFDATTTQDQRDEILAIFPELSVERKKFGSLARMETKRHEAVLLI